MDERINVLAHAPRSGPANGSDPSKKLGRKSGANLPLSLLCLPMVCKRVVWLTPRSEQERSASRYGAYAERNLSCLWPLGI